MQWAKRKHSGFTIVELLIVVVVIAILAAITIVAYNGIQNRAKQSAAQTAAKQAFTKIQSFAIQNSETYPGDLEAAGLSATDTTNYQYRVDNNATPRTFCLTATNQGLSYYVSNTNSSPISGACAGHGANGAPVVTNLLLNPSWETTAPLYAVSSNGGANQVDVSSSTDWSTHGSRSLKIGIPSSSTGPDTSATIGGWSSSLSGQGVTFVPGKTYTISATINVPATQSAPSPRARSIYTANSTDGWVATGTSAPNSPGVYRLNHTFTVPADATWFTARLYNGAAAPNGPVYWDAVTLTEGQPLSSYKDGSVSGWVWNGTSNSATSTGPAS